MNLSKLWELLQAQWNFKDILQEINSGNKSMSYTKTIEQLISMLFYHKFDIMKKFRL